jgi:hypothetical protein
MNLSQWQTHQNLMRERLQADKQKLPTADLPSDLPRHTVGGSYVGNLPEPGFSPNTNKRGPPL